MGATKDRETAPDIAPEINRHYVSENRYLSY